MGYIVGLVLALVVAVFARLVSFDRDRSFLVNNPGMPECWPGFCMAYDVAAACLMVMTQAEVRSIPAGNAR